ncbi:MAG: YegS/Rv2252/BmrU family lipid kinase [Chloroflexi bacterium]|nr:YegS/Rv2252/BmrU family lipid kinase [Chloroflexota bacterium]
MDGRHTTTAPFFFIVNPAAGAGRAGRLWPSVRDRARRLGLAYEYEITQAPLTATSFVRQAIRAGAEVVIAVGGDGTINEALNGFFLDGERLRPGASLAIVPIGSSSDAARSLGIPSGPAALDLLVHGRIARVDVGFATFSDEAGRPTARYFINNADVGIGGRIAAGGRRLKPGGGLAAFFLASVAALRDPRPWEGTLTVDGADPEPVRAISVVVALGPYTGAGMRVAPGAKMDDGLFDVVTLPDLPRLELLWNLPRVYAGTLLSHGKVRHSRAQVVRADTDGGALIELDGEVVGAGGAEFRILPGAIQLSVGTP